MTYLILGEDSPTKDQKIAELKRKYLTSPDAFHFDYEMLYASKLDPADLKKALLSLPVTAPQRFVFLREAHKLKAQQQTIIADFLAAAVDKTVLAMESDQWTESDSFVRKIKPFVKITGAAAAENVNVFDMTRAMTRKQPGEALKILFDLIGSGIHPLQIMGGLVWFWGKTAGQIPAQRHKKGLRMLQEADLNIKRSRLKEDYALEILVVKLCGLLG